MGKSVQFLPKNRIFAPKVRVKITEKAGIFARFFVFYEKRQKLVFSSVMDKLLIISVLTITLITLNYTTF